MKVLVTGATGFIGSRLCQALVHAGHSVRALHRSTSRLAILEGLPVEFVLGDLLDPPSLREAAEGVEVVFHTAAQMGRWADPGRMSRIHVEGTRHVAQAALESGVQRMVYTSSVSALGVPHEHQGSGQVLIDEEHTWNYRPEWWPYGYAKHRAELEVHQAIEQGLDAVIVNPSAVFGAGDVNRVSDGIPYRAARGKLPRLAAPGGLNAVHIDDVVAGHLAAASLGRRGERYILGGENLSLMEFLRVTAEVAGAKPPALVLPQELVRALAILGGTVARVIELPISPELLRLAGLHFYYDTRKATKELRLPAARPYRRAAEDALAWYHAQSRPPPKPSP